MALFSTPNFSMVGISSCVPEEARSNHDLDILTEPERRMLIKTTGISTCRIARKGVTTADLCEQAANHLLDELGWSRDVVDVLILVTQSQDYFLPATSVTLQHKIGLSTQCMALDVSLGCSGYVYGLSLIGSLLSNGHLKKGLLLAGDISTFSLNSKDKSTWPLFGDAGTATAFEYIKGENTYFNLASDGSAYDAIIIPDGGLRNPLTDRSEIEETYAGGIVRSRRNLHLKGLDIMNFSLREVPPNIRMLADFAKMDLTEIDYYLLHQANKLINQSIRKKLKQPLDKFPSSLECFGNTSSASIPLTINHALRESLQTEDHTLLLSGFGVGLSWGSAILSDQVGSNRPSMRSWARPWHP